MAGIYSCALLALRAWAAAGDAAEEGREGAVQTEPAAAEPAAACPTSNHAAPADNTGSAGKDLLYLETGSRKNSKCL